MTFRRLAGISGIAFVAVMIVTSVVAGSAPEADAPFADVLKYFLDHEDEVKFLVSMDGVLNVLFALFVCQVFSMLRGDGRLRREPWNYVGLIGAVLLMAFTTMASIAQGVLVLRGAGLANDQSLTLALWNFAILAFTAGAAMAGLALVAFSVGGWRARMVPQWLGWLGVVGGGVLLIGAIPMIAVAEDSGIGLLTKVGLVAFLVWVLGMSVRMLQPDPVAGDPPPLRPTVD